jgi:NADP-dependent 3-hydroxy acid dehydrogenase YdfG
MSIAEMQTKLKGAEVADAIVFACMQDSHTRVLQMTIRHLGAPQR